MEILFLGTHAMSIGFWSQNWVWQAVMEELHVRVAGVKDERATEAGELSQLIMEISSALVNLGTLPIRDIPQLSKMAQEVSVAASLILERLWEVHASGGGPWDWKLQLAAATVAPGHPACCLFFLLEKL
jgi:hypothetical protein